ncbi:MAG: diguanylate cyclase [Myxococcaceae bacterium]
MPRALIADPSVPVSGAMRKYLEADGFEVKVVHYLDEAVEKVRAGEVDLLFAAATSSFDGETLCKKVKELQPVCPVVLVYPPDEEEPGAHAARAGADAYLVGPLKRATVGSCAKSMIRIRALEERLQPAAAPSRPPPPATAAVTSDSGDFEFFKKLLLMEVKRSRRYRYPVSFLLVALDQFGERAAQLNPAQRTAVLADALAGIARSVRDIDLAVPFKDERFLVFLPNTAREGAMTVAGRLREELARLGSLPGSTASVGVASYEPSAGRAQVSFGSLMKDATEALRRAQAAGGNTVEASEKKPRDRISLG